MKRPSPPAKAITLASMVASARRGIPSGESASSSSRVQDANPTPAAAPSTESRAHSTSSCRITRPRLAPSASRTDISPSRLTARASNRFERLMQAMRSTRPTAPSSINSAGVTSPSSSSRNGVTFAEKPVLDLGYSCASAEVMAATSAVAASGVIPGLSRP